MEKEKLGQEPAFPISDANSNLAAWNANINPTGMSKRFYAACAAMQGIISNFPHDPKHIELEMKSILKAYGNIKVGEAVVKEAYMYADELLKQENE